MTQDDLHKYEVNQLHEYNIIITLSDGEVKFYEKNSSGS